MSNDKKPTPGSAFFAGSEFRDFRQRVGLSQSELATLLGCPQSLVSEWEQGHKPVPQGTIELLRLLAAKAHGKAETNASHRGGINNPGTVITGGGHVVGGNVTVNYSPEGVVEALQARGVLRAAETAGLQRRAIVMLAQRLRPSGQLDFEQAIIELERAVEIALEVIARGERDRNEGAFVNAVLDEAAEKTKDSDLGRPTYAVTPILLIFLCHASEDKEAVRALYRNLRQPGFDPWLDEETAAGTGLGYRNHQSYSFITCVSCMPIETFRKARLRAKGNCARS